LIDASEAWLLRQKSLGAKRRDIPDGVERTENYLPYIVSLFQQFADAEVTIRTDEPKILRSKVFPSTAFGFRKVTIERPLRLNFQASAERIARIEDATAFKNLAISRKKDEKERAAEIAAGEQTQSSIRKVLKKLHGELSRDRDVFVELIDKSLKKADVKVSVTVRRAILDALSDRDPDAPICLESNGNPEADSSLRDTESVPLNYLDEENIPADKKVQTFFAREVLPHVPDAWVNESVRDEKDHEVGIVGYEINFNRYFYLYQPPRPLEAIETDIKAVEQDVLRLLQEVAG